MTLAAALSLVGICLVVAGVAVIYVPAALVAAGVGCLAFGLFGVNVDRR